MRKNRRLARLQLEVTLRKFHPLLYSRMPPKGWIRAIRDALGMSGRQLALRLGVTQQRVALLEKGELSDSLTLKTMKSVGEALDCEFVYGFVPRTSLEQTVFDQAMEIAGKRFDNAAHNMELEGRSLSDREDREALVEMARRLITITPTTLWDEP